LRIGATDARRTLPPLVTAGGGCLHRAGFAHLHQRIGPMDTETETYTARELRQYRPDAFKLAHTRYADRVTGDPWGYEIRDSLKLFVMACGLPNRGNFEIRLIPGNIMGKALRIASWLSDSDMYPFLALKGDAAESWYYATMAPHEFHGYIAEWMYLTRAKAYLLECIRDGMTVQEGLEYVAEVFQAALDGEWDYATSPDGFLDWAEENDARFNADGDVIGGAA